MSLPKGFKRLEYIQSSGTQYVDTLFAPNQNTRVVADVQMMSEVSSGGANEIFGARTSASSKAYAVQWNTTGDMFQHFYNAGYDNLDFGNFSERQIVETNKNVLLINGVTHERPYAEFQCDYTLYLCAVNQENDAKFFSAMRVYSCQIYDNGTLVRDFVPCINASGEVGLYDLVGRKFYGSAGTGTFTAGPVVPEAVDESEITELEYIQSSGTQYLKTGFVPNQDARMKIKYQTDQTSAGGVAVVDSSWTSNAFGIWVNAAGYGASVYNKVVMYGDDPIEIDFNKNKLYKNGNLFWTGTESTFECPSDLTLMALNRNGAMQEYTTGKVFFCMLFDNGLLERDFVPAMLANGEVGLYDRVFHEFYINAGTGEFIAGPEVQTVPKAPANFRVESESDTLVALAWDASDKALGYRLYRQGHLLADTEETSVSVAVEPFAGAVFTLTAYNENGEGAGATLTHYNIPANPLLYLITDRTQQDVTERNPKGYYAASDLNRVGYAMDYLANIIRGYGYMLEVHTKTDWTDEDWKLTVEMVKYLQSLNNLKAVFSTMVELPETMEKIDYQDANNIEFLLLTIDETVAHVVAGFTRANAFGLRSGAKGLPSSQSDRGRNWGQLDAMETKWANWQLATWYLLLYGNLKAEGVVE